MTSDLVEKAAVGDATVPSLDAPGSGREGDRAGR